MFIYQVVLCLGDSLTFGSRDEYGRGYPVELSKLLTETTPGTEWVCINTGVTKETTSDLNRRIYDVIRKYPEPILALLMIGTNDAKGLVPQDIFEDNYRQIIRVCRVFGKRLIVALLPEVISNLMPSFKGKLSNETIMKYNDTIRRLVAEFNLEMADMSGLGKYLCDGVHMSHEGYIKMAEIWKETILKL